MVCCRAKASTSGRPGAECELHKHGEKEEGSRPDTAGQGHREAELDHVLSQSHLGTEWFLTVVAILGCQLDTLGKREPQLRNYLHQIGQWPCLWGIFLMAD